MPEALMVNGNKLDPAESLFSESKRDAPRQEVTEQTAEKSPKETRAVVSSPPPPRDGSVEFWQGVLSQLAELFEEEDLAEAASQLSAAKFRQRHVGKLSQNDLVLAKLAPAVMKDLLDNQHKLLENKDNNGNNSSGKDVEQKHPEGGVFTSSSSLPRIPEEELAMEAVVGEGAFSVVWRATWTRKIAVGTQRMHSLRVAVKMSKSSLISPKQNNELARDLAVISALPHQNILTVHGVCETQKGRGGALKIVYELMSTDLAKLLKESLDKQQPFLSWMELVTTVPSLLCAAKAEPEELMATTPTSSPRTTELSPPQPTKSFIE